MAYKTKGHKQSEDPSIETEISYVDLKQTKNEEYKHLSRPLYMEAELQRGHFPQLN